MTENATESKMKKLFKSALAATIAGTAFLWAGMASAVEIEYWQYTYQSPWMRLTS